MDLNIAQPCSNNTPTDGTSRAAEAVIYLWRIKRHIVTAGLKLCKCTFDDFHVFILFPSLWVEKVTQPLDLWELFKTNQLNWGMHSGQDKNKAVFLRPRKADISEICGFHLTTVIYDNLAVTLHIFLSLAQICRKSHVKAGRLTVRLKDSSSIVNAMGGQDCHSKITYVWLQTGSWGSNFPLSKHIHSVLKIYNGLFFFVIFRGSNVHLIASLCRGCWVQNNTIILRCHITETPLHLSFKTATLILVCAYQIQTKILANNDCC